MSKNMKEIQFSLRKKYEEVYKKSIKSLKEKGLEVCEVRYEKSVIYNLPKVKELK